MTHVASADGFTAMFAAKQDQEWSGGDQATSVPAGGHVYWLFGDSMLSAGETAAGAYPAGTAMVSNRILRQHGGDQLVTAVAAGDVVPDPATRDDHTQERYWPQAGFFTNDRLYVLAQRVRNNPDGQGFTFAGVEMFRYRVAADGALTLEAVLATPSTGVTGRRGVPATVQWAGDAIVRDGYVYVYGYTEADGNAFVLHYTYVARVPVDQVELPSAWRFYAASTGQWVSKVSAWDTDPANQHDAILPTQVSSVRVIGGRIVVAHKPWNGFGSTVFAEVSTSPVGPWTQHPLFESPAGVWQGREYVTYCPQLHPEQTLASGKLLVSMAWNGKTLADSMGDADLYKPRFHEVTLPA
ncbi:DUF4185 domain-containing protein [Micromonospora aurantiaca (nom. illeg.)]|uniref:DUF4185 domain-containing protein n=1 Tax=Micromonospora aurantiaca (nom. illeg.) TaxID=47850 RepID=UPI0011A02EEC